MLSVVNTQLGEYSSLGEEQPSLKPLQLDLEDLSCLQYALP